MKDRAGDATYRTNNFLAYVFGNTQRATPNKHTMLYESKKTRNIDIKQIDIVKTLNTWRIFVRSNKISIYILTRITETTRISRAGTSEIRSVVSVIRVIFF